MLEVLYRVEGILKGAGHILLNVRRTGTRITGHHHDGVSLNIGEQVNGQASE